MKLFDQLPEPKAKLGDVVKITTEDDSLEQESQSIDIQVVEFNKHVTAFNSLNVIDEQIAKENFNFIDKGNYVLYNEYIKSVTANLGMKYIPVLAQETVNTLPTTALNHHIALEGFVGDIWAKIKEIFAKIYNSIKEFFKKYFVRLDRLKNKLKNLSEVLSETDKDIQNVNLESVPNNLLKKYPVNGEITFKSIEEPLYSIGTIFEALDNVNKKAGDFSKKDILDKDFIQKLRKDKDDIKNSQNKLDQNKDLGKTTTRSEKRTLAKDNETLSQQINDKTKTVEENQKTVDKITDTEYNIDDKDAKLEEAKREFKVFLDSLAETLKSVKGKTLINGKVIKEIKVDETTGITIETEDKSDTPSGIQLNSKADLLNIVNATLDFLKLAEQLIKDYSTINDAIMKKINEADRLILEIDKMDTEELGKYKKVLNNKVKVRLNLVKTFFNNYNKVCKNIFDMLLDSADGVVEYSVLSLKHFG